MHYLFGRWLADGGLDAARIAALCDEAAALRQGAARVPLEELLGLLDRARTSWRDPRSEPRRSAAAGLAREAGLAAPTIEAALGTLDELLEPHALRRRIQLELGDVPRLADAGAPAPPRLWAPLGVVLHVLPGNVFSLAAVSLVEGLLAGNVNILKPSSRAAAFLEAFIKSLEQADPSGIIRRSVSMLSFSASDAGAFRELKSRMDGVVVWGGEEAVRACRDDLPSGARLIAYGPRLSLGVVTAEGLRQEGAAGAAERLVQDAAAWDQDSCLAPQACFVQGEENARRLARALEPLLEQWNRRLPARPRSLQEAAALRSWRMLHELSEAAGNGLLLAPAGRLDWSVTVEKDAALPSSPARRGLRLFPFSELDDLRRGFKPWRNCLKAVGLLAGRDERLPYQLALAEGGACWITTLGRMSRAIPPHARDGARPLQQLSRLVALRDE